MRRLALVAVICGTVAPGSAQLPAADGVAAMLYRFEKTLQTSDPAQFTALLSPLAPTDLAATFAPKVFMASTVRAVVKERERGPLEGTLPGDGYRMTVDILTEDASTARLVTARVDVRRARNDTSADAWRIAGASTVTVVEGLHRLAVNPAKQFAAKGFVLTSVDLTLTLADGAVFAIDSTQGTTGLVLMGRGQMSFTPGPQTERDQVRLYAGAETLAVPFETAYVRLHPTDFAPAPGSLTPVSVDPRQLQRAREVFTAESQKSFSLDLSDLSREPWYLLPPSGDFLAELRTKGKGNLTYARSLTESEDVALFERAKGRDLVRYASPQKLRLRGTAYDEDDLTAYDIVDYNIDAAIDPERTMINATATLRVAVRDELLSTLNMHLAEPLTVTSVTSPELGRLLHVRVRSHDTIVVNLPVALRRGSQVTLVVKYVGRVRSQSIDQEGQTQDEARQGTIPRAQDFAPDFPPEAYYLLSGRAYWYPQGVFTGYATANIRITLPSAYGCVASGAPVDGYPRPVAGASESTREFLFRSADPLRYLAVVVSRFRQSAKDEITLDRGTVLLNTETAPRLQGRGREIAGWASDIVRVYAALLDDAPYPTLSIAVVENATPGGHGPAYFVMLHQPPPVTPPAWRDDPSMFQDFPEFFLAHEVAHQWWGQAVGWENYHEQWLSEGFAQYFAALYARQRHGDEKFVQMLKQFRRWAIDQSDQGPVYLGYRLGQIRGDRRVFRALVYNKGAGVLHMLRRLVGDDAFFSALRRFYRDQKFTKAGTEDLRRAFEEETGTSYARFFDRWIYQSRIPRLRVTSSIGDRTVVVTFRQPGDVVFDVPVTVTLVYADGHMQDVMVPVTEAQVERRIPTDGVVRAVRVNRDYAALAEFDE